MNLQSTDYISTDICEKVLPNGKKYYFLVTVDRSSGFISAYQLRGSKTIYIIDALQKYCATYCGPVTSSQVMEGHSFMLKMKQ